MSKSKKKQNVQVGKNTTGQSTPEQDTQTQNVAANASRPRAKRRYSPVATVLHGVTLLVSLVLVCFLSYVISSRTLVEQVPLEVTGWITTTDATGKLAKLEFTLQLADAERIAEIIDAGEYVKNPPEEQRAIQGELTFTMKSKRKYHFDLNVVGVYKNEGYYRQIAIDPAALKKAVVDCISEKEAGKETGKETEGEAGKEAGKETSNEAGKEAENGTK